MCASGIIFDHVYPQNLKKYKIWKLAELPYSFWLAHRADEKKKQTKSYFNVEKHSKICF